MIFWAPLHSCSTPWWSSHSVGISTILWSPDVTGLCLYQWPLWTVLWDSDCHKVPSLNSSPWRFYSWAFCSTEAIPSPTTSPKLFGTTKCQASAVLHESFMSSKPVSPRWHYTLPGLASSIGCSLGPKPQLLYTGLEEILPDSTSVMLCSSNHQEFLSSTWSELIISAKQKFHFNASGLTSHQIFLDQNHRLLKLKVYYGFNEVSKFSNVSLQLHKSGLPRLHCSQRYLPNSHRTTHWALSTQWLSYPKVPKFFHNLPPKQYGQCITVIAHFW